MEINNLRRRGQAAAGRFLIALALATAASGVPAAAAEAAPVTSTLVRFDVGGATVVGTLRRPLAAGRIPIVVMAHGFGLLAANGLEPYAKRFTDQKVGVLTFDYRGFGPSGGSPRQIVDPWAQLDDWRAAIRYARTVPWTDPAKVVLWGTSFSGGHVLQLGSEDPKLAAVIAQVPHVNGLVTTSAIAPDTQLKLAAAGTEDLTRAGTGQSPRYVKLIGKPSDTAAMNQPGTYEGYIALIDPSTGWKNEVAARIALQLPFYSPDVAAGNSRVPTFIGVGTNDVLTPPAPARALARRMNATFREYPGGHFDVYRGPLFERVAADEVAFLRATLARASVS